MHDDRQLKADSYPLILISCYVVGLVAVTLNHSTVLGPPGFSHGLACANRQSKDLLTKGGNISSSIYTKLTVSKRANYYTFD